MPSPDSPNDNDVSPEPATPRKASSAVRKKEDRKDTKKDKEKEKTKEKDKRSSDDPHTPSKKAPASSSNTPKSAPAATHQRQRSNSRKPPEPPTLLTDFLKGRPSPARLAAERERRKSVEAVKAELRHEMRQSAVRRVQPPGGVKDRVKAWQKANAAAKANATPDDAATEPTDVAFDNEEGVESVTEEDRIRIKMRQKKRSSKTKPIVHKSEDAPSNPSDNTEEHDESKPPPKKRVVSDDNWMKSKDRRNPQRRVSPKTRRVSPTPRRPQIPKDFTLRTAPHPNVSNRVKSWAQKVEVLDTPSPRGHRSSKSRERSIYSDETETEVLSEGGASSSQATARQSLRLKPRDSGADDGIRVKAVRKTKLDDDGIRITPTSSSQDDDGIRVRPTSELSSEVATSETASTNIPRGRSKTLPSRQPEREHGRIDVIEEPSELSQTTSLTKITKTENIEVVKEPEPVLDTPTKRRDAKGRPKTKERPQSYHPGVTKTREDASWIDDDGSNLNSSQLLGSDLSSSLANKSVADIPGEIPWGHSAFSELDLPLNGPARSRPKRPKSDKNPNLKGMPNMFKKVMEEGKKMIHEMNEPPRPPASNNPPSIEKWLNNTLDPFVDDPKTEKKTTEQPPAKPIKQASPEPKKHEHKKEKTPDRTSRPSSEPQERPTPERTTQPTPGADRNKEGPRRKSSYETKNSRHSRSKSESIMSEETSLPPTEIDATLKTEMPSKSKTSDSGGLQRRRAVRSTSSPSKSGRRQLLGMLKEAFQGESAEYRKPPSYQGQEERYDDDDDMTDDRTMSEPNSGYDSRSSYLYDETPTGSELSSAESAEPVAPRMAGPRLRPPTNGNHELSTILSEEDSSAIESDLTSDISRSTLTQSTVLTKDSDLSKSKNQEPGLKRRLTKHSDLVSVLSLPNNRDIPNTIKSTRSRPSLRKVRGQADNVTAEDLLWEFSDDEGLYMRELKTLVDGVVPVLLSQVVQEGNARDLFGTIPSGQKLDSLSKSVVGMGVALEKLSNAHRKAPNYDIRRLVHWAHGVVPIYNSYLNSWRLGFQDLIVNLAPAVGVPEDEDSLLNAMPRNEAGDIVNANGERVDVAHLLKRPLIRIKHLVKFLQCVDSMFPSDDTQELVKNFSDLQEKARRRYREETARLTDEDAANTDTTSSRDLRTLCAIEPVTINPRRQVSTKDIFSLSLAHSNGQRLECQVELVHRDNPKDPDDPGDLLIRETGGGGRAYLLFTPLCGSSISARTGDGNLDMVVMVRGAHRGRPWHELLTLTSDNEDQILDWLDILPLNPIPPREPEPSIIGNDDEESSSPKPIDIPVGARSIRRKGPRSPRGGSSSPQSPVTPTRSLPSRYHPRRSPAPTTPPRIEEEPHSPQEKTPTQDDYLPKSEDPHRSRPLHETMRPDPLKLTSKSTPKPFREDGAPPPPIHRTLSVSSRSETEQAPPSTPKASVKPPVELKSDGKVKRRTSSPLKHEYLPSDGSSGVSGESVSDPEYSDSDDEIESIDVPETELGVSIKHEKPASELKPVAQVPMAAESECSLTPSNSASQAGLDDHNPSPGESEPPVPYLATISRWSDRGMWKDVTSTPCTILVTDGLIEAFSVKTDASGQEQSPSRPLLAMDLTPLVLIRQSTAVDLEIRSSVQPQCRLYESYSGGNFRFRCDNGTDCYGLYMAVHNARLKNQKFIQLENEARFKSFGERQAPADNDGDSSSRRRSWFGRKNSYRSSVRAPSQSQDGASTTPSSSVSASSFLKRLSVAGNLTFNLARSSVDKQSRAGSIRNSLYTSGSSSSGATPPRSPSVSIGNSGYSPGNLDSENIRIRLHLLVGAAKWEDQGNCILQIRRPPPGWHQALRADHGLEKRVTVTTLPKKDKEQPRILLDAVLGSGCFTPMGSRGIVCGVWEEVRDGDGVVGMVPATGATGGNIKKWCFQCASVAEASWVLRLVHQEVFRA